MERCIKYLEMVVAYNTRDDSFDSSGKSFWRSRRRSDHMHPSKELRVVADDLERSAEDAIVYLARRVAT